MSSNSSQHWCIAPQDPLVWGQGGVPLFAFVRFEQDPLPPCSTMAGAVRTAYFFANRAQAPGTEADLARKLLKIEVQGPWLIDCRPAEEVRTSLLFPGPFDAVCFSPVREEESDRSDLPLNSATVGTEAEGRSILWPRWAGSQRLRPVHYPRQANARVEKAGGHLWRFDALVEWALYQRGTVAAAIADVDALAKCALHQPGAVPAANTDVKEKPVRAEPRVHVALDSASHTARPGFLFSTPGQRYDRRFEIGVDVNVPEGLQLKPPAMPGQAMMLTLGARSRTSHCRVKAGSGLPRFAVYEGAYRKASEELKGRLGLRLQLLTPGYFGGGAGNQGSVQGAVFPWSGSASPLAPGLPLRLVAVALPEAPQIVSGWDLARQRPRRIRRLVPPGTVYYFKPEGNPSPEELVSWCQAHWLRSLCATDSPSDLQQMLAAPAHDGYGLALPGFWQEAPAQEMDQ